ncbi:MAG: thiamine pyrophosphate-dependent enzyme [bacterium]|nr:thiamine pyrophosphate-dependent enzyme [bacterium]
MDFMHLDEFIESHCARPQAVDFEGEAARWCPGCGDFAILSALERLLAKEAVDPSEVVCLSGIGCSGRFPYYLKTFGFHGIHGRAIPISTGVALANEKLKVITVMGDGDCFSIGLNHWLHGLRYNVDLLALVFDNQIYGLTKQQASPTTPQGTWTTTTPGGAWLPAIDPLALALNMSNRSFVAQTATWLPGHLQQTLESGWAHRGLSFIRILQRCPKFSPQAYGEAQELRERFVFLQPAEGSQASAEESLADRLEHDPSDLKAARRLLQEEPRMPLGLLYRNPAVPSYQALRLRARPSRAEKLLALENLLDRFSL